MTASASQWPQQICFFPGPYYLESAWMIKHTTLCGGSLVLLVRFLGARVPKYTNFSMHKPTEYPTQYLAQSAGSE